MYKLITILLTFGLINFGLSQHNQASKDHHQSEHASFLKHRIAAGFGYTYVPEGADEATEEKGILVPTLSAEYFYKFTHKWAAGIMLDLELSQYVIPFLDDFLTRNKALVIGVVGLYEPLTNWGVYAGGGMEIEEHHNFAVLKLGTDYEFLIGKNWDISPSLTFDYKEKYTVWSLMVGVGKHF
jgi:hypothetical protein